MDRGRDRALAATAPNRISMLLDDERPSPIVGIYLAF
jgi:hypothetical protein